MARPLLFLLLVFPVALFAQLSHGYASVGLGTYQSKLTSQYALGGEWVAGKRCGVGGELGVVAGHTSFVTLSASGYYHPPSLGTKRKLSPFVAAGGGVGTLNVFGGSAALANFGGGVNYWFHRRLGLRLEMRDMVTLNHRYNSRHFWGFRTGLSFH